MSDICEIRRARPAVLWGLAEEKPLPIQTAAVKPERKDLG
jgi:hypothetical protein